MEVVIEHGSSGESSLAHLQKDLLEMQGHAIMRVVEELSNRRLLAIAKRVATASRYEISDLQLEAYLWKNAPKIFALCAEEAGRGESKKVRSIAEIRQKLNLDSEAL